MCNNLFHCASTKIFQFQCQCRCCVLRGRSCARHSPSIPSITWPPIFPRLQPMRYVKTHPNRWSSVLGSSSSPSNTRPRRVGPLFLNQCLKGPQVIETRPFFRIGYALITVQTKVKMYFVQYLNSNQLFLNWSAWSPTVITADETHSKLISLPYQQTNSYQNNRQ